MTYLIIALGIAAAAAAAFIGLRLFRERLLARASGRASGIVADAEIRAQARLKEGDLEVEEKRSASERYDTWGRIFELSVQRIALHRSESAFTLLLENLADRHAGEPLDLLVHIDERNPGCLGGDMPDDRLAGAHHAVQKDWSLESHGREHSFRPTSWQQQIAIIG